jgi:hypothetical protein
MHVCPDKAFLCGIFGIAAVAQHAETQAVNRSLISFDEETEGMVVSVDGLIDPKGFIVTHIFSLLLLYSDIRALWVKVAKKIHDELQIEDCLSELLDPQ